MKRLPQLVSLAIILVFTGCKKETSFTSSQDPQLASVAIYLNTNFPDRVKELNLESITGLNQNGQNIGYRIYEKSTSKKFILIRKEESGYYGNWVDLSALSKDQKNNYSGNILIENINDGLIKTLVIANNKIIQVPKVENTLPGNVKINHQSINKSGVKTSQIQDTIVLQEVVVEIHNDNYLSLYWLFDGYSPFDYYYIPENSMGGSDNVVVVPVFNGPKTPIKDISDELKCFTIDPKSSYSISVNVNQPSPNTTDKINTSQEFMAGHTFLTLEQNNQNGSGIVRNIGFYPQNIVYPGEMESPSIFGDDSETPFTVSLKITVSGEELNKVINALLNQQSINYDLENFNCVNAAANALRSIKVNLPLTTSGVPLIYYGVNPGDFGQDIRNLDLKTFSEKNGNRQMKRTTSNKDDVKPPPKKGSC